MSALAWVMAVVSTVALLIALQVGVSCAASVGPYCAALFFFSWAWLAYQHERGRR